MSSHLNRIRALVVCAAAAATFASPRADAVSFDLVSHVGDDYSYTLTYGPNDNMWYAENGNLEARIALSGLFGVTAVTGPTSTDFPAGPIDAGQLEWAGSVHAGGTVVIFTMPDHGVGTGNFPGDKHVFGFTLIAPNTREIEKIVLDTNGFYSGHTLDDRDVHKIISGPGLPVPEPSSLALAAIGLGAIARAGRRTARR